MKNNFEISEKDLKRFNWGALLMGWIWGIFNRTWITLIQLPLSYIPKVGWIFGLICAVVFGFKGNYWAFKHKNFESSEDFHNYQRKFIYAGIVMLLLTFFASFITVRTTMLIAKGSSETALYIVQLATAAVLGGFCLILIYLMNVKKSIKTLLRTLVILLAISLSILPILGCIGKKALKLKNYDDAAIIYKTMAALSISPVNKNKYYNLTAACYIEKKDINNMIKYFEKAENADKSSYGPENDMLTDLYIIKGENKKVEERGGKYKTCALNSDWACVINEVSPKINKPRKGMSIDGEIYADSELYLARAIAYRNSGKIKEANQDLNKALKVSSTKQADYLTAAFNASKTYYKDYYKQIKTALEIK